MAKHKVDSDLKRISKFTAGLGNQSSSVMNVGIALLFLLLVFGYAFTNQSHGEMGMFVVIAGVIGGYMAINIGANDVANNIGPAVGSKALTMAGALIIAAIFEGAGAMLAGGDVIETVRKGIIDPAGIDAMTFIYAMMAALFAAALWLNLATWVGAPVSTTHSIVGGVVGSGIAALGTSAVNWTTMSQIAASWVISPLLGGIIAALFLLFIKKMVLSKDDKLAAARTWVPMLVGIMAGAFGMYLTMKGLNKLIKVDAQTLWAIGFACLFITWAITKPLVKHASKGMENRKKSIATLFTIPLIFSAALLSFAHGANDVANAVGPLAAIVSKVQGSGDAAKVALPLWVMMIGALGIAVGLLLFGPKLIRTVGGEITKLNQIRAFCVALSAAITVIAASWLGLPVSSTHIAVGGVFGVGFLREYLSNKNAASEPQKDPAKAAKKAAKRKLVRRKHLVSIALAWVITVPVAAGLSAVIFYIMTGLFVD